MKFLNTLCQQIIEVEGNDQDAVRAAIKEKISLHRLSRPGLNLYGFETDEDLDLTMALLPWWNADHSRLKRFVLTKAIVPNAQVTDAVWEELHVNGADVLHSKFVKVSATGARGSAVKFSGSEFESCDFTGMVADDSRWDGCYVNNCKLVGDFKQSVFVDSKLSNLTIGGDWSGVKFDGATMINVNFASGVDITGASFHGIVAKNLRGIDPRLITPMEILREQPGAVVMYYSPGHQVDGADVKAPARNVELGREMKFNKGQAASVGTLSYWLRNGFLQVYRVAFDPADIVEIPIGSCDHALVRKLMPIELVEL